MMSTPRLAAAAVATFASRLYGAVSAKGTRCSSRLWPQRFWFLASVSARCSGSRPRPRSAGRLACAGFDLRVEITGNPNGSAGNSPTGMGSACECSRQGRATRCRLRTSVPERCWRCGKRLGRAHRASTGRFAEVGHHGAQRPNSLSDDTAGRVPRRLSTWVESPITINTSGIFTMGSTSGKSTDICAALSG